MLSSKYRVDEGDALVTVYDIPSRTYPKASDRFAYAVGTSWDSSVNGTSLVKLSDTGLNFVRMFSKQSRKLVDHKSRNTHDTGDDIYVEVVYGTTNTGKIVQEYIERFPNTANTTLAKKIFNENKVYGVHWDEVRALVRYYKGAVGDKKTEKFVGWRNLTVAPTLPESYVEEIVHLKVT